MGSEDETTRPFSRERVGSGHATRLALCLFFSLMTFLSVLLALLMNMCLKYLSHIVLQVARKVARVSVSTCICSGKVPVQSIHPRHVTPSAEDLHLNTRQ